MTDALRSRAAPLRMRPRQLVTPDPLLPSNVAMLGSCWLLPSSLFAVGCGWLLCARLATVGSCVNSCAVR